MKHEPVEVALCIIKPDAMQRGLTSQVLRELITEGLDIVDVERMTMSASVAESLYAEHRDKDFFEGQIQFMTSGPSLVIKLEGYQCVQRLRRLVDSLRLRFRQSIRENVVHGSSSTEAGVRETEIFFPS